MPYLNTISIDFGAYIMYAPKELFEQLKELILSIDSSLVESVTRVYVSFKKGKRNTLCLCPRSGWIEVVLNAKLGQIKDESELIYDISNRQWSAEQYAFKFFPDTDINAVKNVLKQTIELKNKR